MILALLTFDLLVSTALSYGTGEVNYDLVSLDYRLPDTILPERYEIYLVPFHPQPSGFTGNVTIRVTVASTTDQVILHSQVHVSSAVVRTVSMPARELSIKGMENAMDLSNFLVVWLDEALVQGDQYDISLQFSGWLHNDIVGLYKRFYFDSHENRVMVATQFEATSARTAFPCFDEPSFKATFQINIARFSNVTALSNMPLASTSPPELEIEGRVWDRFAESPMMSTYLVAVVMGDLEAVATSDPRLVLWVRRGVNDLASYAASFSPRLLRLLEDYTALPYSLPKLHQVALPGYAVAMENWGLIIYMETTLLYSSKWTKTTAGQQESATIAAHELAHQWFGNLVTPYWWSNIWLSEGLAQFFAYWALDKAESSWRMMEQFVVSQLQPMLKADASATVDALDSECATPAEIDHKFGLVSYAKGASVTRMIQHVLTEETFRKGIHDYLVSRQFTTAEPCHLYGALQVHAEADDRLHGVDATVQRLFGRWTSQPGVPVITVHRNYNGGSAIVSQSRFFLDGPDVSGERWCVPLSWTSQTNAPAGFAVTTPSAWIMDNQSSILLQDVASSQDWVVFNNQQSGYYRVNYDEANWRLLMAQLDSDDCQRIHVLNRAQILDDAFNLARAGHLDYQVALNLTRYLSKERDSIAWTSAFNGFSFIDRMLFGSKALETFHEYVLSLLRVLYDSVGFNEDAGDPHWTSMTRSHVLTWACNLGHTHCVHTAQTMFSAWVSSGDPDIDNAIHPNLKRIVYCTAIANGGDKEWNFLLSRYQFGEENLDKNSIVEALSCSKNPTTLKKYLKMIITGNSGLQIRHANDVFSGLFKNQHGIDIALSFLVENFRNISELYDTPSTMATIITGISKRLTTKQQIKKLEDFLISHNIETLPGATTGQTIIAPAKKNLEWKKRYYHTIEWWLAENKAQTAVESSDTYNSFLSWTFFISILIFFHI